jgi:Flp pilus assembly pilin Flp
MMKGFWQDERGTSPIEYAMIGVSIMVAVVTALGQLGDGLVEVYSQVAANFE